MIVNPENKGITWWMAGQEGLLAENGFFVQMNQHASHLMYLDYCKKRKKKWTYLFEGKEKRDWDLFGFSKTELARLPEPIKAFMSAAKQVHLSGSSDQFGSLVTGSFEPLPDEQQEIISRFAIAFNQAYIRFLDLQKAEAQAREAQIEAALERVRSEAMAMHKSDELLEAGEILFLEMQKLGIESLTAGYVLIDKQEKNGLNYTPHPGTKKIMPVPVIIPHNETIHMQQVVENWKKGKPFFIVEMDEEETIKHQTFIAERSTNFPLTAAQLIAISPAKLVLHNFYFKEGYVLIVGGLKLSAEQTDIMLRFAKVFQQTYTRFLDLQKAEAQAREAAIELGLERVRARAMAMQRSDELSELVDTVFKELTKLDFALNWCMINIIDESSMSNTVWAANPDINEAPESYHMLFENYPFHDAMMKGWKERKTKDVYVLEGEEKKVYDEYLFNETEFRRVPAAAQAASRAMEKYVVTFTFSNFGGLQTVGEVPLSDANIDILSRFGKVFDLTYTRFNDLQKAEAQAREAQIEAALERVRSRSMAMHSSQELKEVALELRKQMGLLGQKDLEVCAIHLYDDDDSFESWSAMKAPGSESEILQTQARFPKQGIKIVDELMKHYSNGSRDYVLVNEGEKIVEWLSVLKEHAPELHASIMQSVGKMPINKLKANWSVADFSGGALVMVTYGEPDVQSRNLLRRSANVFEQAYIRFKDLKQAEQQARDSQIEAALERVRSRTMGMQKSEELKEVIQVVNEQFVHLHINVQHAGFLMDYKESEDMHIWLADPHKVPSELTIPYFDSPHWNSFREAKEKGLDFFANQLDYEEKNRFYNDLLKLFPVPDDAREYYLTCPGLAISTVLLDNIGLYIENFSGIPYTGEENAILMRFGKVFEQAYIRFNDLKQAEIQAREAHIEAALERIRSRSMALQKSSELEEVIRVVFNEWKRLGLELYECNINIIDEDTKAMTIWSYGWGETSTIKGTRLQFFDHPFLVQLVKDFREQTRYGTYEMAGEESREYLRRVFTETDFKYIADEYKQALLSVDHVFINNAFMKYGSLDVISSEALPNDKSEILIRFAKVFEQAYTRFLDLQKAEAQARDAQIEAALERIRAKVMAMNNTKDLDDTPRFLANS